MAVRLAEEGAKVLAVDRDQARLDETLSLAGEAAASITTCICDVTDSSSVKAMVQACLQAWGVPDILINNVGGSAAGGPIQLSEQDWDSQIDINLKSVFLTCKHVLPHMVERGSGAIVNVASTSGLRWTGSAQVAYAASKAGVIHLSRVVAVQHAPDGIRVNTVVPGQLHTPWWKRGWPGSAQAAMWRRCWPRGSGASRWASWAMAAIPPVPPCTWPATRPAS